MGRRCTRRWKGSSWSDPALTGEKKQARAGHLHYRVDRQPVIATTATVPLRCMSWGRDRTDRGHARGQRSHASRPAADAARERERERDRRGPRRLNRPPSRKPPADAATSPRSRTHGSSSPERPRRPSSRPTSCPRKKRPRARPPPSRWIWPASISRRRRPPEPRHRGRWGPIFTTGSTTGRWSPRPRRSCPSMSSIPGPHTITVALAGADHTRLGPLSHARSDRCPCAGGERDVVLAGR